MTKTTAINVPNQDALPEMTRVRLYVVNVKELYISSAQNFQLINSSCSTPKIIVNCVKVPDKFQQLFNKQEERFFEKCQREVEACDNIIKVQRENEEKLINGIKKLRSQKEKEDQNKEDVTKLIEEKFDQLEKRLTSNLCNQENITVKVFCPIFERYCATRE